MKVGIGGTFNVLHRGHKALLNRAFEVGDHVSVGITSDRFASSGRGRLLPLEERRKELEDYLQTRGSNWSLEVIEDPVGRVRGPTDVRALIVSPETKARAESINLIRAENGLSPLQLILVPHVLAEDGMPISATRILEGEMDRDGHMLRAMRVNVGSDNPIKIDAVRNVLSRFFSSIEVEGVKVDTEVPEQPFGEQTRQGAMERANASLEGGDFGVGLEAGVFETADGLYDVQYCAIMDKRGVVTIGHGSGFRYPEEVAKKVREGLAVGETFHELYGLEQNGRRGGAIGYLTKGVLDRTGLAEQAVLAAMVPRIRQELYGQN